MNENMLAHSMLTLITYDRFRGIVGILWALGLSLRILVITALEFGLRKYQINSKGAFNAPCKPVGLQMH